MRPDLRLVVLMLLYDFGRQSAPALARASGASLRTVHRLPQSLRDVGAPFKRFRGRHGGYALEADFADRLKGFERAEVEARLAYGLARKAGRAGFDEAAQPTRPPGLVIRDNADAQAGGTAPAPIMIDPTDWEGVGRPGDQLGLLESAIADRKVVSFSAEGEEWTVEPLKLVWKAQAFYLLGRAAGEVRAFALLNLDQVRVQQISFESPDEVWLAAAWTREGELRGIALRTVDVTLSLDQDAVRRIVSPQSTLGQQVMPALRKAVLAAAPGPGGGRRVSFPTAEVERLVLELAPIAPHVAVVAPPELGWRLARLGDVLAAEVG